MRVLLQRVSSASVTVADSVIGSIGHGMLLLVGFSKGDDANKLDYHLKKLSTLRIFSDDEGKMNRSIQDVDGAFLVVSQFTLAGDCRKGTRPSFDSALPPDEAKALYDSFVTHLRSATPCSVATGEFGAMMDVALVNDGPVTFLLEN